MSIDSQQKQTDNLFEGEPILEGGGKAPAYSVLRERVRKINDEIVALRAEREERIAILQAICPHTLISEVNTGARLPTHTPSRPGASVRFVAMKRRDGVPGIKSSRLTACGV